MDKVETRLSRRNVLLGVGGASVVGALFAAPIGTSIVRGTKSLARSVTSPTPTLSLANGSYDLWAGLVGSVFALGDGSRMQLVGVRAFPEGGTRPANLRARAFVAVFDPLGGARPASDIIYTANHALHGPVPIFLAAASDSRTPARMLAVFN